MDQFESPVWKCVAFAGIVSALGCSAGAPGDEGQGENQGPNTAGGVPVGTALEWTLDPAAASTSILEGSQVQRTAEQQAEGNLLYEIRLSDTKVVQFLETEGEEDMVVSYIGSDMLDAHPPDEFAPLLPSDLFARITGQPAPDRLVNAELTMLARDALRMQSGVDDQVSALTNGPSAPGLTGPTLDPGRDFLESQWWVATACSGAGINYHFWMGTEYYHRWVGCYANLHSWVSTGDLGITFDYRIAGDATNNTAASMKYWYVHCDTILGIQSCGWKNTTYGVSVGTWREVDFLGHQSRATEYNHPTGGYFAVKYSGTGAGNVGCIGPAFDCVYHNK